MHLQVHIIGLHCIVWWSTSRAFQASSPPQLTQGHWGRRWIIWFAESNCVNSSFCLSASGSLCLYNRSQSFCKRRCWRLQRYQRRRLNTIQVRRQLGRYCTSATSLTRWGLSKMCPPQCPKTTLRVLNRATTSFAGAHWHQEALRASGHPEWSYTAGPRLNSGPLD